MRKGKHIYRLYEGVVFFEIGHCVVLTFFRNHNI